MRAYQQQCWGVWFALTLVIVSPCAFAGHASLQLLGRSSASDVVLEVSEADRAWLQRKGGIVLGVALPEYPPFDLIVQDRNYEGIHADYASLIGDLLRSPIEVRAYDSHSEAVSALNAGELDLIATEEVLDEDDPALVLSQSYVEDQPVHVTRIGDSQTLAADLAGKRVAIIEDYWPSGAVQAAYPGASVMAFPSLIAAVGAVAFGQADVYVGDAISANYMISKSFFSHVQISGFSRLKAKHFSFMLKRGDQRLLRLLSQSISAIPSAERFAIQRRWTGGLSVPGDQRLGYSAEERRWLDAHPRIQVVVHGDFQPISFFDDKGIHRGVSADLLAKISLRSGLRFEVLRGGSLKSMVRQVESGAVDLLGTFNAGCECEQYLNYTRPYLTSPYVLLTRADAPDIDTTDLSGRKLALRRDGVLYDFARPRFPQTEIVPADTPEGAVAHVAKGLADASIYTLVGARYLMSRQYRNTLRIAGTVDYPPAQFSIAMSKDSPELQSIIEKALMSIPPDEIDSLNNSWRSDVLVVDSYWERNRTAILQGFAIAGLALLIALGWITYLRKLVREKKQAEVALNDQVTFMRSLIYHTPHPIYIRDLQSRLVVCNPSYLEALNVSEGEVLGKRLTEIPLIEPEAAQVFENEYTRVMTEGVSLIGDRSISIPRGRQLDVYHWMLPHRDAEGRVVGLIAGWIDISDRTRLFHELDEAKRVADDANRAKTTFLATMSHEIRTPINAILGMLELVQKRAEQGTVDHQSIDVAADAAQGLLGLIGDILDIVKIESGHLSLSPERANLRQLIETVVRVFEGAARQKLLRMTLSLDEGASDDVLLDPLRFKQIIFNLLSNAIKFTADGEVRIALSTTRLEQGGKVAVSLTVHDTGIGISEKDQAELFRPFSQASNNNQSVRSGSGLGLMISRTLCEMMDGELHLNSTLGVGTNVEVRLVLTSLAPVAPAMPQVVETPAVQRALNILIVDDYPANRLLLSQQLTYLGHRVSDAADGAHGLRAWRSDSFAIVITDCNMPIMSGYELARAIRDEEAAIGAAPCVILGLTANAQPNERERCIAAGMDDCLFKPIGINELRVRLAQVAHDPVSEPTASGGQDNDAHILDLAGLEQISGGDSAAIKPLLIQLAICNDEDCQKLRLLLRDGTIMGLADLSHRIKGGARMVKALAVIDCCEQLEAACQVGDSATMTRAVDALEQAMQLLRGALERYMQRAR